MSILNSLRKELLTLIKTYENSKALNNENQNNSLKANIKNFKNGKYIIAVVGHAKVGKSKFINAFIGHEILPTDILQCTSSIIEIQHSKSPQLEVNYLNGKKTRSHYSSLEELANDLRNLASLPSEFRNLPIIEINDFLVLMKGKHITKDSIRYVKWTNSHNLPKETFHIKIWKYIQLHKSLSQLPGKVYVKLPFLKNIDEGSPIISIVDTPGMQARGGLEKLTLSYMHSANATIFVHTYKNIENSHLHKFYNNWVPNYSKGSCFLVLTHRAQLVPSQTEIIINEAKILFKEIKDRIFFVDSMLKIIFNQLSASSNFRKISEDEEKYFMLKPYLFDFGKNNVRKIKAQLLADSHFEQTEESIHNFLGRSSYNQIKEIIEGLIKEYDGQEFDLNRNRTLLQDKLTKTPEEFKTQITALIKNIDRYEFELNSFTNKIEKEYSNNGGKIDTIFQRIKKKYLNEIEGANYDEKTKEFYGRFHKESLETLKYLEETLKQSFENEIKKTGKSINLNGSFSIPQKSLDSIDKDAKSNSYETQTIYDTTASGGGAAAGLALGALFTVATGGWGALIAGPIIGGLAGSLFDETRTETTFSHEKYLSELKEKLTTDIKKLTNEFEEVSRKYFKSYMEDFNSELRNYLNEKRNDLRKIKDEEKDQNKIRAEISSIKNQLKTLAEEKKEIFSLKKKVNLNNELTA